MQRETKCLSCVLIRQLCPSQGQHQVPDVLQSSSDQQSSTDVCSGMNEAVLMGVHQNREGTLQAKTTN